MPRRYTQRQKATAVMAATVTNVTAAAESQGIPEATVRYWMDRPEFAHLRAKTREDAAKGFTVLMHLAQARLTELVPTMEPRDLTVLLGVATDKAQLLSGGPTDRTETRDITDFDDHESEILGDVVRTELARRADGQAAGDAVVGSGKAGAASPVG